MSGVLQRLEPVIGDPLSPDGDEINPLWGLSKKLAEKEDVFFHPLVLDHMRLNLRYTVICAELAHDFARKESGVEPFTEEEREALTRQLVDALTLAELLTRVYIRLNVPREIERLQSEQKVYRMLLSMRGYDFPENSSIGKYNLDKYNFEFSASLSERTRKYIAILNWPYLLKEGLRQILILLEPFIDRFSTNIRSYTGMLNFPRLMVVRIRRILMTLLPILKNIENYAKFINLIDPFFGPVLNYLSWIFYFPRLIVNLFLLFKHLIPGSWLSEEEKQLGWFIRLQTQLQRRWFELFNDSAWFIGGLLGCFFLVGGLSPVGMYLTISLFLYDVVLAGIRAYIELSRLNTLRTEYTELALTSLNEDPTFLEGIASYQKHLEQSYSYEQKRMGLSIASTIALFLGMLFAIPAISNPIVPLVGACLIVMITLLTYLIGKYWVEAQKPPGVNVDKITDEGKARFEKKSFEPPLEQTLSEQIPFEQTPLEQRPLEKPPEKTDLEKPTFAKSSLGFFLPVDDSHKKPLPSFCKTTDLNEDQLEELVPQIGIL
jgi:hypothetical protein